MVERPTALRLGILVFDGVMMSSIAAPSDALRVADKLAQLRFGAAAPAFRTFLLAMSGLLDGRPATTSWWLAAAFRQAFPLVELQADELVVESGEVTTAGGASAVLDFVLRQIARVTDAALAQQTAKLLLVDPERQSQAPYVSAALIEKPRSTLTEKIEKLLSQEMQRTDLAAPLPDPVRRRSAGASATAAGRAREGLARNQPAQLRRNRRTLRLLRYRQFPQAVQARDPSHAGRLPRTLHAARALAAQRRLHQICTRVASGRTIASPALQPNASAKPSRLA